MKNMKQKLVLGGALTAALLVGAVGGAGASGYFNDNTQDLVAFQSWSNELTAKVVSKNGTIKELNKAVADLEKANSDLKSS
ncbi:hypothetical protein QCM8_212 [Bacillus phage QCM8]|nr:hypothetical protein QCM8_212 [Bacillus phage QCM8]